MTEAKPTPETRKFSTGRVVTIILIAALATVTTILVIQNLSLRSQVNEGIQTAEELTSEIDNVEQQLKDLEFAMNTQDLEIQRKEEMLAQKETLVQQQEAKIANLLAKNRISEQEASKLSGRVEQLEYYVNKYEGQIAELKEELAARDAQIAQLTDSLGNVASERDSIRDKSIYDGIKLKAAQKLTAHSFKFFRKKQSGTPVEETEFRASQMDHLKICMTLADNNTTKKGEKDVHIQILDPSGKLVKDDATSGFFKYDDDDVQYTTRGKVNYQGESVDVCTDFAQPKGYDYPEGNYKVIAYCENRIIGKSEFIVK